MRSASLLRRVREHALALSLTPVRLTQSLHAPARSRLSSRLRIACMPQARAARAQPHTHNRRLHLLEPAALYHPNNPEIPGSPACDGATDQGASWTGRPRWPPGVARTTSIPWPGRRLAIARSHCGGSRAGTREWSGGGGRAAEVLGRRVSRRCWRLKGCAVGRLRCFLLRHDEEPKCHREEQVDQRREPS